MPKFAGIDPSLTGSAVVTYNTETKEQLVASFSSSPDKGTIQSKLARVQTLSDKIVGAVVQDGVPLAVGIEGPAYSSNTGKVWDRAGLWWLVVQKLEDLGITVIEIPPTSRAKYITGKGNAGKDTVLLEIARNYADFDVKTNDQADALGICAFIARLHDQAFDGDLPRTKTDAIAKLKKDIQWDQ